MAAPDGSALAGFQHIQRRFRACVVKAVHSLNLLIYYHGVELTAMPCLSANTLVSPRQPWSQAPAPATFPFSLASGSDENKL